MNEYNFTVYQGSEFSRTLILKEDDGSIINLTDYDCQMQIRKYKDKTSELYDTLSVENERIKITPSEGKIVFKIPSSISDNYTWVKGYYDLEIINSNNNIYRKLQGIITIDKNVTNIVD
jgi:hypothetical protein